MTWTSVGFASKARLAALAFLCVALVGCGGSGTKPMSGLVPVTGTVTHNGQPVAAGTVTFVGGDGTLVFSGQITNGRFQLAGSPSSPGARPGEYRVCVRPPGASMDEAGNPVEPSSTIPEKFTEVTTSGLAATVPPSGGDLTIELK